MKDFQARAERTPLGQGAISGIVIFILLIAIVWNLPDSAVRKVLAVDLQPVANAAGLDQNWGVFAPDPPRQLTYLTVEVTTRGGKSIIWRRPASDPVVRHYWVYRWRKLDENLTGTENIRKPFANWVVEQVTTPADPAARVKISGLIVPLVAPDSGRSIGQERTVVLYDEGFTQ